MKRISRKKHAKIVRHLHSSRRRLERRRHHQRVAKLGELRLPTIDLPRNPIGYKIAVPRQRNRVSVELPSVFSLRDNYEPTVTAIVELRHTALVRSRPVMLHFENLREIEPAAILMLAAEIYRCKELRPYQGGLIVNGTYPPDSDVFLQLREMGFYNLIGIPEREEIPDERESADRPRFLKSFTFDQVTAELAASLSDVVSAGAFSMSDLVRGRMTGAVKEAMGNAVEHAYPSTGALPALQGRWWCASYISPHAGEMMIILYDQGVGVPETLGATVYEQIKSLLTNRSWQPGDGHMIAAATELYRTSTKQAGRGRGFRDMKKFIDSCDDGELRVLSNRGSYRYMKGSEEISNELLSIGGTLVEWRVRHGQAVELEDA